ncbi:serine/threonine protein phosphatase [Cyclobacteriaceae bacterium YHN15]|nr:serine/threonine protein phosphatase [Cyclobacteriaceae bacterium YHN15]
MKNRIILSLCLSFLLLGFSVSAQDKTYVAPSLENKDAWTLVLFPDTQTYVKFKRNQPIVDLMVNWVDEHITPLNIKLVLHVGDLVEHNGLVNPDGIVGNQTGTQQWEAISRSLSTLDTKVPVIATTGNHDFGIANIENRQTFYNKYFPIEKNHHNKRMIREVALGDDGMPSLTNALYEFIAPDERKFLILVLEFAPRESSLQWAIRMVNQEKYRDHTVILLAHSYLDSNSNHIETENYPITDRNYGKAIWEKLVKPSRNIQMVFSGHIGVPDQKSGHVGFRTDTNAGGKKVHQMTFNAQALGGGWHGNGGDGWLRMLEFQGNRVTVRTFSSLFAISPSTRHLAWGTEAYQSFIFDLD